jgi:hypothetical protein
MRIRKWWLLPLLGVFLIAGGVFTPSHAQGNNGYFSQTGHSVTGEFLDFYSSNPEATLLYGFPITDEFIDNMGRDVQYFQKARFEIDPTAEPGKRVKITDVGSLVFEAKNLTAVSDMPTNTPACARYGAYYICNAFLDFFKKHGGLAQFGYPISNYSIEGDRYIQYFERARFEYHPELSSFDYVLLTDIGLLQYDKSGNDPSRLNPVIRTGYVVTNLKVSAFVKRAVVRSNDEQTLYVVVLDQLNNPLLHATVNVEIYQPDGVHVFRNVMDPTDGDGVSKLIYNVEDVSPNQVYNIIVKVTYQGLQGSASTWYRSWW